MSSSKSILKSTSLIGGSKIISIIFRIIKNKIIAMLLGPNGLGLISALQSTHQLVEKFSALGLNKSAVRDVAKAYGETTNTKKISITIITLRRAVFFTGLLGMIVMIFLASALSEFTFGSSEYILEIRILAIVVFFNLIRGGQEALLQGMRKIKVLAKMTVWSSLMGTIFSIPILYLFELDGVTVFLIALSLGQLIVSYYYAKKVNIKVYDLNLTDFIHRTKSMLKLGFAFMGSGLVVMLGSYLIRVIIIRFINLDAAGIYQAAFAISTMYIGVILDAMGKDFYPRLTSVAEDSKKEISIINDQIEIGMYLAAPGLLFTMALAPYAIKILYTAEFLSAYSVLQWMILGVYLRTISWPLGYLFISRGKGIIFFLTELISSVIHVFLVVFLIDKLDITGTGIAFFLTYLFNIIFMFVLAKKENEFRWSTTVSKAILVFTNIFGISFLILVETSEIVGSIVVSFIGLIVTYMSVRKIMEVMETNSLNELISLIKSSK